MPISSCVAIVRMSGSFARVAHERVPEDWIRSHTKTPRYRRS